MTERPDDNMAAELALGLLEGDERAAALRRLLANRAFAADVERWRDHFGDLFEAWPVASIGPDALRRIEAELDAGRKPHWYWPAAATIASIAAAVLLALVFVRPAPPSDGVPGPIASRPLSLLAGTLAGDGIEPVTAVYTSETAELRLTGFTPDPGRSAELWAIGTDGVPHSLGLLAEAGSRLALDPTRRARLVAGVTLAISIEPPGGSPADLPTGPVVATGSLNSV